MKQYPGYTVLRTEDCPEQHGALTVLTHEKESYLLPYYLTFLAIMVLALLLDRKSVV